MVEEISALTSFVRHLIFCEESTHLGSLLDDTTSIGCCIHLTGKDSGLILVSEVACVRRIVRSNKQTIPGPFVKEKEEDNCDAFCL